MSPAADLLVPRPTRDTAPHFQAAADGRLSVPRCDDCGASHWYPSRQCPTCHGWNICWPTLSGEATLYSFVVVGMALFPSLADRVPYVLGLVELPDAPGVRLVTDLVGVEPADAVIGMPLVATFETLADGIGLVHFTAA